jgi:hypothetical protein
LAAEVAERTIKCPRSIHVEFVTIYNKIPRQIDTAPCHAATAGSLRYLSEFVGRLDWGDIDLPGAYYRAAYLMLAVAAAAAVLGLREIGSGRSRP